MSASGPALLGQRGTFYSVIQGRLKWDSPESDWNLVVPDISTEGSKHRTCLSFPVAPRDGGMCPSRRRRRFQRGITFVQIFSATTISEAIANGVTTFLWRTFHLRFSNRGLILIGRHPPISMGEN